MKFYLSENSVIELAPEIASNVMVVNESKFEYNKKTYLIRPIEFNVDDVYFLLYEMVKNNPGKRIFIQKFEPLANNSYAMYHAIEE